MECNIVYLKIFSSCNNFDNNINDVNVENDAGYIKMSINFNSNFSYNMLQQAPRNPIFTDCLEIHVQNM